MGACERSNNLGNENLCKCSSKDCDKWGKCCSCVIYHCTKGGIPACFFPEEAEKTGKRSLEFFIQSVSNAAK
ncbi:MAG: DUF6485 family protein [Dehalococcoidia bacterium]|nr:DUF6485 family protein [Dehalococcoidia bacterium]